MEAGSNCPQAHLARFLAQQGFENYWDLYRWSIESPGAFWAALRSFASLPADGEAFNFAEVLLRHAGDAPAIVFRDESGRGEEWSGNDLLRATASYAHLMRDRGIQPGDRVAGLLPNLPESIALMLAAVSIGAVWSSCSPDFGPEAVLDRFSQIEPKLLFAASAYSFNGKRFPIKDTVALLTKGLPSLNGAFFLDDIPLRAAEAPEFLKLPPTHPLFILYSSGTTGLPKCIVHSAGGTLAQIVKEHLLHVDLHPGERLFYYTTCGWMMWNWLAVGLASGAVLVLYDGSPFHPDPGVLWRLAAEESIAHFGTSAKYLALLEKRNYQPRGQHAIPALRQILSTGSPLLPASFDFVEESIKPGVHLASISGGTDIVSCFVLGNPLLPVQRGKIQCAGLGMDVQVWNAQGERIWDDAGELVCVNAFPSMPLGFWNDSGGHRYRAAYFGRYPGVWHHGDWAEQSSVTQGFTIFGRSDATLNPGGVRIGTSEIYRQVESIPEILECVAVGQRWQDDVRIFLFVRLQPGFDLDNALKERIRFTLKTKASPHHVPKKIVAVSDIPRTVNGKVSESSVRDAIHGRVPANVSALSNPECIKEFQACPELLQD